MLPSVEFDNQQMLETNEVDDVIPDRVLPLEFVPVETVRSNAIPKSLLGLRCKMPHVFRALAVCRQRHAAFCHAVCDHDPLSLPLPPDGGEGILDDSVSPC